jgi:membrane-associated phospholipid phosphatase
MSGSQRIHPADAPPTVRIRKLTLADRAALIASAVAFTMVFVDPAALALTRGLDPKIVELFRHVTDIGKSGWVLLATGLACVLSAVLASRAHRQRLRISRFYIGQLAGFVFVSVAGTGLVASLAKGVIGRARPILFDSVGAFDFSPFAFRAHFASFPSGHATTIFALATALAIIWPRARIALFTAAIWLAGSRVIAGAHYLSDVVAGGALGIGGTLFVRDRLARMRLLFHAGADGPGLRGRRLAQWAQQGLSGLPAAWMPLIRRRDRRGPAAFGGWDRVSLTPQSLGNLD